MNSVTKTDGFVLRAQDQNPNSLICFRTDRASAAKDDTEVSVPGRFEDYESSLKKDFPPVQNYPEIRAAIALGERCRYCICISNRLPNTPVISISPRHSGSYQ